MSKVFKLQAKSGAPMPSAECFNDIDKLIQKLRVTLKKVRICIDRNASHDFLLYDLGVLNGILDEIDTRYGTEASDEKIV